METCKTCKGLGTEQGFAEAKRVAAEAKLSHL